VRSLTWDEVRSRRLARSHLLERAPAKRLVDVVRDVGGIHAQVMGSAELQLAARVEGITQQDVRAALWERRELVKAWTLRGTLHLHPAAELPLWIAARRAVGGDQEEQFPDHADEVLAAIAEVLDGRALLREELADEVARRVGEWAREPLSSGWGYLLGPAVAAGRLCHGPPRGTRITFVRADQWIGSWVERDPAQALADVARRFLAAYGPARPRDFREWFTSRHFGPNDARELFAQLALAEVKVEGTPTSWLADEEPVAPVPTVRLLPEYDVYVMGFREREQLVPPEVREQVAAHGKGRYEGPAGTPFLLVDGVCAGIWSRKKSARKVELTVVPARKLTRGEKAGVEAEAERIGAFLGVEPVLTLA
jgi:hypothetical protein